MLMMSCNRIKLPEVTIRKEKGMYTIYMQIWFPVGRVFFSIYNIYICSSTTFYYWFNVGLLFQSFLVLTLWRCCTIYIYYQLLSYITYCCPILQINSVPKVVLYIITYCCPILPKVVLYIITYYCPILPMVVLYIITYYCPI